MFSRFWPLALVNISLDKVNSQPLGNFFGKASEKIPSVLRPIRMKWGSDIVPIVKVSAALAVRLPVNKATGRMYVGAAGSAKIICFFVSPFSVQACLLNINVFVATKCFSNSSDTRSNPPPLNLRSRMIPWCCAIHEVPWR